MTSLPLPSQRWFRPLAIASASLLVTSLASIGQVRSELKKDDARVGAGAGASSTAITTPSGADTTTAAEGGVAPDAAATPGATPGATVPAGSTKPGTKGAVTTVAGGAGPTPTAPPFVAGSPVPDFGLRTQSVTDKEVTIGYSYNVAGCGDSGTLQATLGAGTTGDQGKALDAFTRHVNDTGGIAGRKLKVKVADDGGGGCSEKAAAAATQMADDDKVFLAIPGLHSVSDILIAKKVPVFGGRDDPESLARIGANGIMVTEAIEPTLEKWAAFGRYYLDSGAHTPCLIHPESGDSGDWNNHEKIIVAKMKKYGLTFKDIITYKEDVSTAQQQANTYVARAKANGCDQVYFMAGNPIALIFFTQAATQNRWFPLWTFTSYMVLSDSELGGRLMDQQQWANAVGLSTRVPPGQHPREGNCRKIYEKYYPNDGQSDSASVQIVCAQILSVAEIMRRAVQRTGVLTGNSVMVGADSIRNDFFYDAHVPLRWSFPGTAGPFKTKGFSHYTVVKWSPQQSQYLFPEYPKYWEVMGPDKSGAQDLRPFFK
jgi:ABC-type branched-subunit amino acid transport system substrate-binding protein